MTGDPADGDPLLSPAFLDRLESLHLTTGRRLGGRYMGEHRANRYGTSLDFADFREYHPGDDYRRIDYNLYARLDQLVLKLFEAEDDLTLRLLVDTSGSMAVDRKLRTAATLAAALGFLALIRRNHVVLRPFPAPARSVRRFTGRHDVRPFLDALGGLAAGGAASSSAAVAEAVAERGVPGMTVLLSDLMTADWEQALQRLPARGDDLLVVHVLAPSDLKPELRGDLELVDVETRQRVSVSLSDDTIRGYESAASQWVESVRSAAHRVGARYLRVSSEDDPAEVLFAEWRRHGVLR